MGQPARHVRTGSGTGPLRRGGAPRVEIASTVFGVRAESRGIATGLWSNGAGLAGSCVRPKDSCITQLKAQGTSKTCNESQKKEETKARVWIAE